MASRSRSKHAGSRELEEAVSKLPSEFVDCRDPGLRHAWDLVNNMHVLEQTTEGRRRVMFLGRDEECQRCGTVKHERFIYTKNGIEKSGQTYEYPEGYIMPGIPRGVKPSVVIYQEQFRRSMEEAARALPGERETAER